MGNANAKGAKVLRAQLRAAELSGPLGQRLADETEQSMRSTPVRAAAAPEPSAIPGGSLEEFHQYVRVSGQQARSRSVVDHGRDREASKGRNARPRVAGTSSATEQAVRAAAGGNLPSASDRAVDQSGLPGVVVPSASAIKKLQKYEELRRRQYASGAALVDQPERVDEVRVAPVDAGVRGGVRNVQKDRDDAAARAKADQDQFTASVRAVVARKQGARLHMVGAGVSP